VKNRRIVPRLLTILLLSVVLSQAAVDGQRGSVSTKPLRDGFVLAGADGVLIGPEEKGCWFFQFDSAVTDDKGIIKPGQRVEMLTCSTLEKMTADMKGRTSGGYRLWGQVTRYKNKNYIFGIYFLPLSVIKPTESAPDSEKQTELKINDPNDAVIIPQDVVEMLKPKRAINLAKLKKGLESEKDGIFSDRTGFIVKQPGSNSFVFALDALGRNVQDISFKLLYCEALEQAVKREAASPDRVRYKVAGILTKYHGRHCLLLQRAAIQYNHGNLAR